MYLDINFRASRNWVDKIKKNNQVVSRKVTKFVSKKDIKNSEQYEKNAENFRDLVKPYVDLYGPENVFNTDQSGFQMELHSGRTLAKQGTK